MELQNSFYLKLITPISDDWKAFYAMILTALHKIFYTVARTYEVYLRVEKNISRVSSYVQTNV